MHFLIKHISVFLKENNNIVKRLLDNKSKTKKFITELKLCVNYNFKK